MDTTAAAPTTDKATEVLRVVTACAAAPSVALCNNVVLWTPSRALALRAASVTARANAGLAAASVQGSSIGIDVTLDRDKTALYDRDFDHPPPHLGGSRTTLFCSRRP